MDFADALAGWALLKHLLLPTGKDATAAADVVSRVQVCRGAAAAQGGPGGGGRGAGGQAGGAIHPQVGARNCPFPRESRETGRGTLGG